MSVFMIIIPANHFMASSLRRKSTKEIRERKNKIKNK